jgi:hypothetical protein
VCSVHVHNVDGLLTCMLPYHATPQFSRLVQICRLKDSIWSFLGKMQETGATLPRHAVAQICFENQARAAMKAAAPSSELCLRQTLYVHHAAMHIFLTLRNMACKRDHPVFMTKRSADSGFTRCSSMQAVLQQLCASVRAAHAARALSRVAASFYATLLCEVLLRPDKPPAFLENLLQMLLQYLLNGLRPAAQPNLRAATHAVAACLLSQAALTRDAAAALVVDVSRHAPDAQLHEALMLAAHALETQPALAGALPAAAAAALAARAGVATELAALQHDGLAVEGLAAACAVAWCGGRTHEATAALRALMHEVDLSDCAGALADAALSRLVGDEAAAEEELQEVGAVVRALDAQHPAALDAAVRGALERCAEGGARERAAAAVHGALAGSVHVPVAGGGAMTAAAAVTASSAALREQAVIQLGALTLSGGGGAGVSAATREFVHAALAERALDPDAAVALAALAQPTLLEGAVPRVAEALCKCLGAAAVCIFGGAAGAIASSSGGVAETPAWPEGDARKVAKAALSAAAKLLQRGSVSSEQATKALAAVLPFCAAKSRGLSEAAVEALRAMPLCSPFAGAVEAAAAAAVEQPAPSASPAKEAPARKSASPSRKKVSKGADATAKKTPVKVQVIATGDAAAAPSASSALEAAQLAQCALAHAMAPGGGAACAALSAAAAHTSARGRHVAALALMFALRSSEAGAAPEVAQLAVQLFAASGAPGAMPMGSDEDIALTLELAPATGLVQVGHVALLAKSSKFAALHAGLARSVALAAVQQTALPPADLAKLLRALCALSPADSVAPVTAALLLAQQAQAGKGADACGPLYALVGASDADTEAAIDSSVRIGALAAFAHVLGSAKGKDCPHASTDGLPYLLHAAASASGHMRAAAVAALGPFASCLHGAPPGPLELLEGLAQLQQQLEKDAAALPMLLHTCFQGGSTAADKSTGAHR